MGRKPAERAQVATDTGMRIARQVGRALGHGLGWARALSLRALRGLVGAATRHRVTITRLGERVAWWLALSLLVIAGRDLLSGFASDAAYARIPWLAWGGFALTAWVAYNTPARHLRRGSVLLGSGCAGIGVIALMAGA